MKKISKKTCYDYKNLTIDCFLKNNLKKIHFVGVGGISMHSLAIYAKLKGFFVSGSDIIINDKIKTLEKLNINFYHKQIETNIIDKDIIIFSNAVENGVEVAQAKKLNKIVLSRAEFLSIILKDYKNTVCVSGAHGKTTTTALIYSIFKKANKYPSLHLGGNLVNLKDSYVYDKNEFMICEACEYKDSFLKLNPMVGVILNICPEHLDYFKNFQNIQNSFNKFANNSNNIVILNEVKNNFKFDNNKSVFSFGFNFGIFTAKHIKLNNNGTIRFSCFKNNKFYCNIDLNLIGQHNILNALASICVADLYNIKKTYIKQALRDFCGVERRFEFLSEKHYILHDYAHHPDEINAVLTELKKFYKNKLLIVFQPHTYSRTKTLMKEFVNCLKSYENVVIYKTYSAREKYNLKGAAVTLARNLNNSKYYKNKEKLCSFIKEKVKDNYGVIFLGAGDIYDIAKIITKYVDNCDNIW